MWTGGGRFAHTALVRFDTALRSIFGLTEMASVSTFSRFFRRFGQRQVEEVFADLSGWFWERVSGGAWTVDLDSSVLTRYGQQEGSQRGYNPWNRGKKSHHPPMAFAAECRMVITAWLRPGNTTDSTNAENFFREVLAIFGQRHRIGLLRCDIPAGLLRLQPDVAVSTGALGSSVKAHLKHLAGSMLCNRSKFGQIRPQIHTASRLSLTQTRMV